MNPLANRVAILDTLDDLIATADNLGLEATADSLRHASDRFVGGEAGITETLAVIDGARFTIVPAHDRAAAAAERLEAWRRMRQAGRKAHARRALHIAAFMIAAALVVVGGGIVLMNITAGMRLGIGAELFIGIVWGWMSSGLAFAYWQERIAR